MNLVERLRSVGKDYDFHENALIYEAADTIESLHAQLTETRDLAEHHAILAEQRRVELGECRKLLDAIVNIPNMSDEQLAQLKANALAAMEAKP